MGDINLLQQLQSILLDWKGTMGVGQRNTDGFSYVDANGNSELECVTWLGETLQQQVEEKFLQP